MQQICHTPKEETDKRTSENEVRQFSDPLEFLVLFKIELIVDTSAFGWEYVKNAAIEHLAGEVATVEVLIEDGLIKSLQRGHRKPFG